MTRVLFLGTPKPAVPTLQRLAAAYDIVGVVTRPDRPRGRSRHPRPSAVKQAADALHLPVVSLREAIANLHPDVAVVVAYGVIIDAESLEAVPHGFLNVHFSLLPRWRGATPVEHALLAGDDTTGVTVMRLDEGLDTGPVVAQRELPIRDDDDAATLTDRLAEAGAALLVETLPGYLDGSIVPEPQNDERATYAPRLPAAVFELDPAGTAVELWRTVRAAATRGGARIELDGDVIKVWRARPGGCDAEPGQIRAVPEGVAIGTTDGCLIALEVQAPGRRRMRAADWWRGLRRHPTFARRPTLG